ncbi:hypothetical protein [Mycoplasma simbae]|uniref:hypothetical protein n=1 Tax=Mycoplasma simbae TaxID=36744 RepID=UPI000496B590|nr:hypothetical protein [Mycoplasma simbae]
MNYTLQSIMAQFEIIMAERRYHWSLSPQTYWQIKNNSRVVDNFSISIYWEDYARLSIDKPEMFKYESYAGKDKTLMPYFDFNGHKMFLSLIIGTDRKINIEQMTKKIKNRLLYWGDNTKKWFFNLKMINSEPVTPVDLVGIFHAKKYTHFVITDSNLLKFTLWNNLNWNQMKTISVEEVVFPYFEQFDHENVYLK